MADNVLKLPQRSFLIFIDETGNEDFSDPKNPTFGRGGCGALMTEYKRHIAKPWRRLKREKLGGATKPFHATEFEQTRPAMNQITAIKAFMKLPFWRFATMCDSKTEFPDGMDAHKAISLVTINYFSRLISSADVEVVALIFEGSERGDSLVKRDYDLANMNIKNRWGHRVEVEGCFMTKEQMEPGLEVADLIAHTASRQRRHELAGKSGHTKDFQQTYWHRPQEFQWVIGTLTKPNNERLRALPRFRRTDGRLGLNWASKWQRVATKRYLQMFAGGIADLHRRRSRGWKL
jgi:hypothetical protein